MTGVALAAALAAAPATGTAEAPARLATNTSIAVTGDILLSANEIIGQTVYGARGRALATVDDVIVTRSDHVVLAVLSVGGFLGFNDRLVAIPYDRLSIGENGVGVADLTEGDLNAMAEVTYRDGAAEWLARNRYMNRMDRAMNQWSLRIDQAYDESAETASKGAKTLSRETSQAWDQVSASYRNLKRATAETWNDARDSFERALDELESHWDRAAD